MSITYVRGNLFESPAQVLVNTVNLQGVMGKGVALEFKRFFPEMFVEYRRLCEQHVLAIGKLHLYKTPHKWVLNFPTKTDWRKPSRVEHIEAGLKRLREVYLEAGIHSLAMPPIGCGNGQLDWRKQVGPLVHRHLDDLPIAVYVYPARASTSPPEHLDVERMREWLRSEPESLPFDEVWADVVALVGRSREFQTGSRGTRYSVTVSADPPVLHVETNGKKYTLEYDELLDFWQQLRQHGITFRSATPEHLRISYLIPLFEQLPYVHRVEVSASDEGLVKQPAAALQVVPPSRPPAQQGSLFRHRVG